MVWVARTSGVRFVNPLGDLPGPPPSDLPSDPVRETPIGAGGETHTPPLGETHTPLGKAKNTEGTTSSAAVRLALSQYGTVDDDALSRLINNCQVRVGNCTEEEIVYFIHEKSALTTGKGTRIQNPIGFLIDAVPKCFSGDAIRLYRQLSTITAVEEPNQEERDREWGREHAADLDNPSVPESVKDVIKKCLGLQ